MLIACPTCATSYTIAPASLGQAGRTVRCSRCKATWFAAPEAPPQGAPEAVGTPTADIDAFAKHEAAYAAPADSHSVPEITHAEDDFGPEAEAPIGRVHEAAEIVPAPTPATVADAPPLVPPIGHEPLPGDTQPSPEDIESFAARRQRLQERRKQKRLNSRWTALLLVLFAGNVALIGARDDIVRYLPQTASLFSAIGLPVNLRHLTFENVRITHATENGVPVLIVEGSVMSAARKPVEVPRMRFAARNAAKQEIYIWTLLPERNVLAPGETLEFTSRLASPPKGVRDVVVRFFTASDAIAGAK